MSTSESVIVTFEPYGTKSEFKKCVLLLDALKSVGLNVRSDCGGRGICGKCRIIVKDSSRISSIVEAEKERLSPSELRSGYRLACCTSVIHDATILVPEESRVLERKFLIEGTEKPVAVDPAIRKFYAMLKKPTLSDVRSDVRRLIDFLQDTYGLKIATVDYEVEKLLPEILRKADWKVTVSARNNTEIVSVESGDTSEEIFGIAVDIGTSKIVGYLSNLETGKLLSVSSSDNPQVVCGEDVISRLLFASKGEDQLRELQKLAVKGVEVVIEQACKKSACNLEHIYEMMVVGNTAMHHLFLGLQPKYLGTSPYVPVLSEAVDIKARELPVHLNPSASIHVLPVIAGFVGADAVADIISTEIYRSSRLSLVIDIGTNTELILGNRVKLIACSCASGPAFEGAHIKCGVKAVKGAIEKLQIAPSNYRVRYQTVENAKPIGICGSGIIDTVADLLKCRLIDKSGRFSKSSTTSRLRIKNGKKEFVLVSQQEGAARDIVVTQKDIEQVQLAKAAIYAGCSVLMKKRHVRPHDIENVFLAGAFGNFINIDNAKLIGMLPHISTRKIKFVGNAAGSGGRMALISTKHRQIARLVARKVQYVELGSDKNFEKEFTSAMFFQPGDSRA